MDVIVRAFPVLPGKEDAVREFTAQLTGPRAEGASTFYRGYGVVRETWHLQKTDNGMLVIGVTMMPDAVKRGDEYAKSQHEFDSWFRGQVLNLSGIDPASQPLGPPTELIFRWEGGEAPPV